MLLLLGAGLLLCLIFVLDYRQRVDVKSGLHEQFEELNRQSILLRRFQQTFETMRAGHVDVVNTRVRWTHQLEKDLASYGPASVNFIIEDPDSILTDLSEFASAATVRQYPVRIESSLENDSELFSLLQLLSGYTDSLFENRGCRIRKEPDSKTLQLQCLYAIYDIVLNEGEKE